MENLSNSVMVLSANCQGLRDRKKRLDVFDYFKQKSPKIVCLQDTHLLEQDEKLIRSEWNSECIIHGTRTNARGVAILFGNNFEYSVKNITKDREGNLLIVDVKISDLDFKIINLYGPNTDCPNFYETLKQTMDNNTQDYVLICGDFNLVLDPQKDALNYVNVNNPNARNTTLQLINENNLIDSFRYFHSDKRRYTWRKNRTKQARLDYILVSNTVIDLIDHCDIIPGYRSDHSIVKINLLLNNFKQGKGIWKFNTSYLKDPNYLQLINNAIEDEKLKYILPVYNLANLKSIPDNEIQFTISEDTFLEMLLLRIRGESIKYTSNLKRQKCKLEENLTKEIAQLEGDLVLTDHSQLLSEKRQQLEELRQDKIKGNIIRSRVQMLSEGEKPSRYFCHLENKAYLEKTIKHLKSQNGSDIFDQKEILDQIKMFYANLFGNKDIYIEDTDINEIVGDINVRKLTTNEALDLEGPLTENELSFSLKHMKHNKTPGIDGLPSEFLKVFWKQLKIFILRALNVSYDKGILPTSLRQCVITCLPKGNKSRSDLKNWRPISLLSVIYKLASASIANRIKKVLNILISQAQSGFISGRYIGDSTRLIYDIMQYVEEKNLDGLLMQIDFEKAFDSISWSFVYKVLHYFGFKENLIGWIHLFNNNITATVIQSGFLSDFFDIARGARQGDPISAYLFILCAQILYLLILNNSSITGIKIGDNEYKLTQFADDTTLLLDGSEKSLHAALNVLEIFGSVSGLKMNTSKTKLVWLGRKKHSKHKIKTRANLEWGCTNFILLGLHYDVDLYKMPLLNYEKALQKIRVMLVNWKKRFLTPIGKIVVIKTFVLSSFNHLFMTLPSPDVKFINSLNSLLYDFIWEGKPDKINRVQLCQNYLQGGLQMVNVTHFIHALKSSWIRRLLICPHALWVLLFQDVICDLRSVTTFGTLWLKRKIDGVSNQFWKDVFTSWIIISDASKIKTSDDIVSSPLWYNPNLAQYPIYISSWFKQGIYHVGDVICEDGSLKSIADLQHEYSLHNMNILDYYRIQVLVNRFIRKYKLSICHFNIKLPQIPQHLRVLFKNQKGSKDMYNLVNESNLEPKMKLKWHRDLNKVYSDDFWKNTFRICFKTIDDPAVIWLQYRILFRILGTKEYMFMIKLSNSSECRMCGLVCESIVHMFVHCDIVKDLWRNVTIWLRNVIAYNFMVDEETIIFGYHLFDQNSTPVNTIILETKCYIFNCFFKNRRPNIFHLQKFLKKNFLEQELVAKLSPNYHKFQKVWQNWRLIFEFV